MSEIENKDKYFVGVRFADTEKTYYYSTKTSDLKVGDLVIVPSGDLTEIATVYTSVMSTSTYKSSLVLRPIFHKATASERRTYENNLIRAKEAFEIATKEAKLKELPMDFVASSYSFDGSVVTLTYTSPEKRVDFRELLPVLGAKLKARVNLKQIASRDKAKLVGGIGVCGLPLCCSNFLTNFEKVTISHIKNQMLAINVQKYSGPCDKLMCCLLFEDEAYTLEKKDFPRIGTPVKLDEGDYFVNSFNIVSRTVRLNSADKSDFKTVTLEEWGQMLKGTYQPRIEEPKATKEYSLPDYNIKPSVEFEPSKEESSSEGKVEPSKDGKERNDNARHDRRNDRRNRNRHRRDNNRNNDNRPNNEGNNRPSNNRNDRPQQNNPRNNPQNQPQGERREGEQNNRNRHRFNRHRHGNRNRDNNKKEGE